MRTTVKNIKSIWSAFGHTAEYCVNAVKQEFNEFEKDWSEAEAFWSEHPEVLLDCFQM